MGLRSLNIPANAQPKDIGNPIPSQADTLGSVLGGYHPQPSSAAVQDETQGTSVASLGSTISNPGAQQATQPSQDQQPDAQPAQAVQQPADNSPQPASTPDQTPPPKLTQDQLDSQDALNSLFKDTKDTKAGKVAAAQDLADSHAALDNLFGQADKGGPNNPAKLSPVQRWIVSIGRNPQERLAALEKYSPENSWKVNNNGDIEVKGPNDANYQSLEKSWNDDVAPAAQMISEYATGGIVGGAANVAAPGFGTAAGLVAAPVVGAGLRKLAVEMAGIEDPNYSTVQEAAVGIGMNAAFHGLFAGGKSLISKIAEVNANTGLSKLEQYAIVKNAVSEITDNAGLVLDNADNGGNKVINSAGDEISKEQAGIGYKNKVQQAYDNLTNSIAQIKDKALSLIGDKPVDTQKTIDKLAEVISKEGSTVDPETGYFRMPETKSQVAAIAQNPMMSAADKADAIAQSAKTNAAFGDVNGDKILADLIDDHTRFLSAQKANGGSTLKEYLDRTTMYQNMTTYDGQPVSRGVNQAFEKISGAAAADRDAALQTALQGTPEADFYKARYDKFSSQIGNVADLRTAAMRTESGEKIADTIFQPKNADMLAKVKAVIGEGSDEWKALRGHFIMDTVDKAVTSDGTFDGKAFTKSLSPKVLGQETINQMGSDATDTLGSLKKVAQYSSRLSDADEVTPQASNMIISAIRTAKNALNPVQATKFLFKISGGNSTIMDHMLDEGFLKAAQGSTPAEQQIYRQIEKITQNVADNSKVVKIKGIARLIPILGANSTPASNATASVVNQGAQQLGTFGQGQPDAGSAPPQ